MFCQGGFAQRGASNKTKKIFIFSTLTSNCEKNIDFNLHSVAEIVHYAYVHDIYALWILERETRSKKNSLSDSTFSRSISSFSSRKLISLFIAFTNFCKLISLFLKFQKVVLYFGIFNFSGDLLLKNGYENFFKLNAEYWE